MYDTNQGSSDILEGKSLGKTLNQCGGIIVEFDTTNNGSDFAGGITNLFVFCGQGFSLLLALRPFELVQCASPGRGWDLIRPNKVCLKCSSVRPSTKSFFDFN